MEKTTKRTSSCIRFESARGGGSGRGHNQSIGTRGAKCGNLRRNASGLVPERSMSSGRHPVAFGDEHKEALDREWSDPSAKSEAIQLLLGEITSLKKWLKKHLAEELAKPPMKEHFETLKQIQTQDLEPDPNGGGMRIRDGVAPDRRPSIEDPEMRHGRKSKSKRFNG